MIIRKGIAAISAAVSVFAMAPALNAETLGEALTAAYNNSGLIEQNRAVLRAADEDVAQAVAALRPVVRWGAEATKSFSISNDVFLDWEVGLSLSASYTLYDGGLGALAVEAAKESVLGTRQALVSVEQQILLAAVSAYMDVRSAQESVTLANSNVRVLTQEVRAAQDRFDVGEVTRTDVAQAEAALAAAKSSLAVAQGNLAIAQESYLAAVGHAPNNLQPAPKAPIPSGEGEAKNYAVRNHPAVQQAQHAVTVTEINLRRADAALRPTVSASLGLGFDENLDDSGQIGLSTSQTLYAGGALASATRQAKSGRDQARSALLVTTQSVEQGVGTAFAQYEVARAASAAYDQQIAAAQLAFDGVREEANAGSRTTLDVLTAEQDLLDARANRVAAQADEVTASYAILSSMGLLTAEHLQLPVQAYDVEAYYNLAQQAPSAISEQGAALDRILKSIGN